VPSRWLRRLDALLGSAPVEAHRGLPRTAEPQWLSWQDALDRPARVAPCPRPRPAPPVAARPRRLSVTEIETWMRDPYAIFARRILRLEPLDPIDADPGAADRGTIVHKALERFLAEFPGALPDHARDRLVEIGRGAFGAVLDRPGVWAFWWPRFLRIADWVVAQEAARRAQIAVIRGETRAEHTLRGGTAPFTLVAKADRIEVRRDGTLAIVDYKTGKPPRDDEIDLGFSPQLPLEAAMAAAGAFPHVPTATVAALAFWRLSGGADPGQEIPTRTDAMALAAAAIDGLASLIAVFDRPDTPYLSQPDPRHAGYGDYDHLARRLEWFTGNDT
jgi:ATP-dependent helicase/nuclease subunit B